MDDSNESTRQTTARVPWSAWCAGVALLAFVVCLTLGAVLPKGPWATAAGGIGVPLFALVFGALAADAYYRKEGDKKVQEKVRLAAYTTLNIQYALEQAHEPLRAAVEEAYELGSLEQVGELRAAEMAVHLAHGTSHQTLYELDALAIDDAIVQSVKDRFEIGRAALDSLRPRVKLGEASQAGATDNGHGSEEDQ